MAPTITCLKCGAVVPRNPRVKKQKYCSNEECQKVRRRSWKKKNYAKNKSYRRNHLDIQATWREQRPAYEYQKEYRESHKEYVIRNRELQRERNKKRQKEPVPMIVNGNSLSLQPSGDVTYALIQVKKLKDCKWELVHGCNAGIIRAREDLPHY
jgi:endogenous inhibitor of DNA gyrase (YacG/DUF329 family)